MAKILMVGAFDTKGPEYAFLRDQIIARGHEVLAMNTGVIGEAEAFAVDFGADEVAAAGGSSLEALRESRDRGAAMKAMSVQSMSGNPFPVASETKMFSTLTPSR